MRSIRAVLVVADEWFPARGGLSAFNRRLCAALAEFGLRVFCLVPSFTGTEAGDAAALGVHLVEAAHVPGMTEREALGRRPRLTGEPTPDVIIGHGRVTGQIAQALAADQFPHALYLHFVHMEPGHIEFFQLDQDDDAGVRAEQRARLELDLARKATAGVAVGPLLAEWLERDLDDGASYRFDPGFDAVGEDRRPPGGIPQILLMGRMGDTTAKGVDIAAEAVGQAYRLGPGDRPWDLLVRGVARDAGDETYQRIVSLVDEPGVRVRVYPYSPDPATVLRDLRQSSLLLMPSRIEGFGLAGLEAIVAGTPALISDRSGLAMLLRESLAPERAHRLVVPVRDDGTDPARWGHRIAAVLLDRGAAFTNAAEVRSCMAATRTWSGSVRALLAFLAGHA